MARDLLQVTTKPIDLTIALSGLADPACGAQLVFIGTVRQENQRKTVEAVHYEAFIPLAESIFRELAEEVRGQIEPKLRVVILHRLGILRVGEVSTVIGVSSPHRGESYDASRYLIEQLKVRVPIWKEEHYVDGERVWLDGAVLVAPDCNSDYRRPKNSGEGLE